MDTAQLTGIDAKAQALCSQVMRLVIEESLKEPRFGRMLGSLEEMMRVAREGAGERSDVPGVQEELGRLLRALDRRARQEVEPQLTKLLEGRHVRRTAWIESLGQHLTDGSSRLSSNLTRLGSQVSQLEIRVAQLSTPPPAAAGLEEDWRVERPFGPTAADATAFREPPSPSSSLGRILGIAVVAAALVIGGAFAWQQVRHPQDVLIGEPDAPGEPAPAGAWQHLWSQALAQPLSGSCRGNPGAMSFQGCFCPHTRARARCEPDRSWSGPQLVAALEAVLRVKQETVWVDGELGHDFNAALQRLSLDCAFPDAQEDARMTLEKASYDPTSAAAARDAALSLLQYVQRHPACAQ